MLSFEQAPPISVTFRFFLTAPCFGVAAGLLFAESGPAALASRWTPSALALTHLLTVGFMLHAMCGALLQFVPVATGANVWRPLWLANLVHPALLAGASILVYAMANSRPELLAAAELLLGVGLVAFCAICGVALFLTPARGISLAALRAALVGLAVTSVLGLLLAQALSSRRAMALPALADLHAAWGLGGWALTLLAGVSFTVVPMFQMTPPYPRWMPRWLPTTIGVALVGAAVAALAVHGAWSWNLAIAMAVLMSTAFAGVTLLLQRRRRRARTDASFALSRGAMISLLAAGAGWLASIGYPGLSDSPWLPVGIGIVCLVGVFVSAINGMLYKIVPFVICLKLPAGVGSLHAPPNIRMFISERAMDGQMRLHFAALAMLLASLAMPQLARPAGLTFAASCGWLGLNLLGALRVYRSFKDRSPAVAAARGS